MAGSVLGAVVSGAAEGIALIVVLVVAIVLTTRVEPAGFSGPAVPLEP